MSSSDSKAKKREWRKQFRSRFPREAALTREYSQSICDRIALTDEFQRARQVAIFHPFDWEIDLRSLWHLRPDHCYFPRVLVEARLMEFYRVSSLAELKKGFYDILEPPDRRDLQALEWGREDLVLCPGMFFDLDGGRLGGGLGLYDRFLSGRDVLKWAVCGSDQILQEKVALDATDVRMDALCTEKGWIRF